MTHQPAISFSNSFQFLFNRAGGRTSNVVHDMDKEAYDWSAFENVKNARRIFLPISFISFATIFIGMAFSLPYLVTPVVIILVVLFIPGAVVDGCQKTLKCPRCQKAYFFKWLPPIYRPSSVSCVHCGLPWGSESSQLRNLEHNKS